MSYFDTLYVASFRGAIFFVKEAQGSYGRKVAVHGYPQRDGVYPEDMGRKAREFDIEGFLVGDDVLAQRDYMVSLVEQAGPGLLVHPTRGIMNVSVLDFGEVSSLDNGRVIKIRFQFIEAGAKLFPSVVTNAFGAIANAVDNLFGAGTSDFVTQTAGAIQTGISVVSQGAQLVGTWAAAGNGLVKGATNLLSLSSSITGNFGRYAGGSTGSGSGSVAGISNSVGSLSTQISNLIGQGATARAVVSEQGNKMVQAMSEL